MGGKAFSTAVAVPKEHIPGTIDWLKFMLGGKLTYRTLGSTNKKDVSGDIDLGVSDTEWTYDELVAALEGVLGKQNVSTQGRQFNQIYTLVPSLWKHKVFYQVDFMLGDIDVLEYTHWSPNPGTSQYSGSHRTEYLKSVAKALSHVQRHNGRIVARVGHTLHHNRGLEHSARWCKPRKDGEGYVVKMTNVEDKDIATFKQHFPDLDYDGSELITDVDMMGAVLFGKPTSLLDVNSYEQIAELIKEDPYLLANADLIWKLYTERLHDIGQPIPVRLV